MSDELPVPEAVPILFYHDIEFFQLYMMPWLVPFIGVDSSRLAVSFLGARPAFYPGMLFEARIPTDSVFNLRTSGMVWTIVRYVEPVYPIRGFALVDYNDGPIPEYPVTEDEVEIVTFRRAADVENTCLCYTSLDIFSYCLHRPNEEGFAFPQRLGTRRFATLGTYTDRRTNAADYYSLSATLSQRWTVKDRELMKLSHFLTDKNGNIHREGLLGTVVTPVALRCGVRLGQVVWMQHDDAVLKEPTQS